MFSLGLHPLIDKPSRITEHSATLINNMFINELNNNISSGLIICDVTYHLPVFGMLLCKHLDIKRNVNKRYIFIKLTAHRPIDRRLLRALDKLIIILEPSKTTYYYKIGIM